MSARTPISVEQVASAARKVNAMSMADKVVNRAGFPGDFNLREDGVYGNSKAVFE